MAKRVQFIRHSTGGADSFVGLEGEVTVDITAKELRVHDGLSAGGTPTARKDLANVVAASAASDGKMTQAHVAELVTLADAIAQEVIDRIADVDAEEAARIVADALLIPLTQKAAALGVATLDATSKVVQTALLAESLVALTASIAELNKLDGTTILQEIHAPVYFDSPSSFVAGNSWISRKTIAIQDLAIGDLIHLELVCEYTTPTSDRIVQMRTNTTEGSIKSRFVFSGDVEWFDSFVAIPVSGSHMQTLSKCVEVLSATGVGNRLVIDFEFYSVTSITIGSMYVNYRVTRGV